MQSAPNHYYSITKGMLSLAGQWPYQERRTKLFRLSFVTANTLSLIVTQVAEKFLIKFLPLAILVLNIMVNRLHLKKCIKTINILKNMDVFILVKII